MALTNIFKEPRREITESAIGLTIIGGYLYGDYVWSQYLQEATGGFQRGCPWPMGMVLGVCLTFITITVSVGIVFGSHALGEAICNALQRRGVHLRPRQRFN